MSDDGNVPEIACAIAAGRELTTVKDRILDIGGIPVAIRTNDGDCRVEVMQTLLEITDERAEHPRRRRGDHVTHEVESFVDLVNRYKSDASVVWFDPEKFEATAVLNEHPAGTKWAGWRDHRVVYRCPRSAEWDAWTRLEGQPLTQEQFAALVEDRLGDIVCGDKGDDGATATGLLKTARDLQVHTRGTYQRAFDPTTGASSLVCKTEHESSSTPIPRAFYLGIPVFLGGVGYRIECRIRFALHEGKPRFGYVMLRRKEIERDAFAAVRNVITANTKLPGFAGVP